MKRKVGREWIECGPASPAHSLLSIVLAARHTQGGQQGDDEPGLYGMTMPEKGKKPMSTGGNYDIGTHEIAS